MSEEEFFEWFKDRVDLFAPLGIMHPKSEWGKIVKICLVVCQEIQKEAKAPEPVVKKIAPKKEKPKV